MFNDFSIEEGKLLVRETGARISLDNNFIKEVGSVASFTMEVSAISAIRSARRRIGIEPRGEPVKIAFAPVTPQVWYAIWPVCHLANVEIVRDPALADILFYFEDSNFTEMLPVKPAPAPVINGRCLDIRKSRVAEVFQDVFGYSLSVDPYTYSGIALMKSERNGVHDGQIAPCPYWVPRRNYVFQRLIDNTEDGRTYTDIRTPVVGDSLPVIYLKQRRSSTRFSNENFKVDLSSADEQFSKEEQRKIVQFANAIGLDFGGLDILRDRKDGRIYIVDVNKTDMGPPTALPRKQKMIAMQKLADTFQGYVRHMLEGVRSA